VVPGSLTRRDFIAGEPEILATRNLQVIPDHAAVVAEELMSGDLHIHRAGMNLLQSVAIRLNGPNSIHLMPGPLVAEHDQFWIRRRKL
jgi:hypothetical protein